MCTLFFTVLACIEESSGEPSAALWGCSIRWRDVGELNFSFLFLDFISSVYSQRYIKQGSTGSEKISLLIEYLPEVKAIVYLLWVKMEKEDASQKMKMQNDENNLLFNRNKHNTSQKTKMQNYDNKIAL